jgi:hypothetical protein
MQKKTLRMLALLAKCTSGEKLKYETEKQFFTSTKKPGCNLSASNDIVNKNKYSKNLIRKIKKPSQVKKNQKN